MTTAIKKSSITLFSSPSDHYSHRVRFVLAEKDTTADIRDVYPENIPQELSEHNPYNSLPTLIDRDLVLYDSSVIMEYLDERFPYPPLLSVYPIVRAKSRLTMRRICTDWCSLVDIILNPKTKDTPANRTRKELKESLTAVAPIFSEKPFFTSDELTLIDCYLAPILWRLPILKIELPKPAKPILQYAERIFKRETFQQSLSELELEMRE